MPIFNKKITFIHIPKTGGSTIKVFFKLKGYGADLYSEKPKNYINNHSPQHCTYLELKKMNLLTEKIFTIVRPHVDRVISEFFYVKKYLPDHPCSNFTTFDEFLDLFLNKKNTILFDNHNLSNSDFLIDETGRIPKHIKIFNFFDTKSIEEYLNLEGLSKLHILKSKPDNLNFTISKEQILRIKNFYGEDS